MRLSVILHQAGLKEEAGHEKSTENRRNQDTVGNRAGSMEGVPETEAVVMLTAPQTTEGL